MEHQVRLPGVEFLSVHISPRQQVAGGEHDNRQLVFSFGTTHQTSSNGSSTASADPSEDVNGAEAETRCTRESALLDALSGISDFVGGGPVVHARRTPNRPAAESANSGRAATASSTSRGQANDQQQPAAMQTDHEPPLQVLRVDVDVPESEAASVRTVHIQCGVRQGSVTVRSVHNVPVGGSERSSKTGSSRRHHQHHHQTTPIDAFIVAKVLQESVRCLVHQHQELTAERVTAFYTSWIARFRIEQLHTYTPLCVLPTAPLVSAMSDAAAEDIQALSAALKGQFPAIVDVVVFYALPNALVLCSPSAVLTLESLRALYAHNLFYVAELEPQEHRKPGDRSARLPAAPPQTAFFESVSSWFKRPFSSRPAPTSAAASGNHAPARATARTTPLVLSGKTQAELYLSHRNPATSHIKHTVHIMSFGQLIVNCLSLDDTGAAPDQLSAALIDSPHLSAIAAAVREQPQFSAVSCVVDFPSQDGGPVSYMSSDASAPTAGALARAHWLLHGAASNGPPAPPCNEVHMRLVQDSNAQSQDVPFWVSGKWYSVPGADTPTRRLALSAINNISNSILQDLPLPPSSTASTMDASTVGDIRSLIDARDKASALSPTRANALSLMDVAAALDLVSQAPTEA
ncbi:hypothetical protein RI367_005121 [Sorochytrium milnesiophthora]